MALLFIPASAADVLPALPKHYPHHLPASGGIARKKGTRSNQDAHLLLRNAATRSRRCAKPRSHTCHAKPHVQRAAKPHVPREAAHATSREAAKLRTRSAPAQRRKSHTRTSAPAAPPVRQRNRAPTRPQSRKSRTRTNAPAKPQAPFPHHSFS